MPRTRSLQSVWMSCLHSPPSRHQPTQCASRPCAGVAYSGRGRCAAWGVHGACCHAVAPMSSSLHWRQSPWRLRRTAAMYPRKTDLALTALQSHRSPLTLLQRRALILADGQRDLDTLAALLGGEAATLVQTLCALGYLHLGANVATNAAPPASAAAPSAPSDAEPAAPLLSEEEQQRQRRRATTNARLYLLDILQLQRNPVAVLLHRRLQAARSDIEIHAAIAEALQALPQFTSASYAERVRTRSAELLPDMLGEATAAAAESIVRHADKASV
ncbi:conserved hypothetical protein [Xanthomonas campestris pv. campestris str. 8004]|uniref:Uncharacterized protein n=3 Tax=Xanthomonas campestris TaxID=339 RepID=Q8PDA1_XANCP|nr:conserved hypothetical protein [Xanthomonas campestris pv. campestris str. ATCC 33913]AAY47535.1 conserved hypothetical protein [Xanthomonas campestris pv. campestris str. 8004]QCX65941.1 hypothetical protein DFG55_05185 [Xanthomonas campestris pv. campestris]QCX73284.1 hypothetical protein DFG54_02185 [Xanthomonas campestris pv. campestris]RFF38020.1 hypothetical protein D0A42_21565 [Xanthomonas campestris pv. campestris]